jgi:hypothetical protein
VPLGLPADIGVLARQFLALWPEGTLGEHEEEAQAVLEGTPIARCRSWSWWQSLMARSSAALKSAFDRMPTVATPAPSARITKNRANESYLTTRPDDAAGLPANVVTVPRVPSVAMGQLLID